MIDTRYIGHELPASVLDVERGRLRFFAKAIGETDPIYLDESAARAAGHPDLPAPPTFLFSVELDSGAVNVLLDVLKIDIAKLLHGEQEFRYHRMSYAGDRITVRSKIADIYSKKNGALEFVVRESKATNQRDELVVEMRSVLIVRN